MYNARRCNRETTLPLHASTSEVLSVAAGTARPHKAWRWAWIVLIWAGLAIAGVLTLRSDYGMPARASGSTAAAPVASRTALSVDEWNNKLRLNWNPGDQTLRNAAHAEVEIIDGDQRTRVQLPPAVVANGNITYLPHNQDVGFRLLTQDSGGWKASESIWYIGRTGPAAPDAQEQTEANAAARPTADRDASRWRAPNRSVRSGMEASPGRGQADRTASSTPATRESGPHGFRGAAARMGRGISKIWPFHHKQEGQE